jgi:hypothetical protein
MYKELKIIGLDGAEKTHIVRTNSNGNYTSFPDNPANSDYQEYLKWVAEGGVPEPADSQE